MGSKFTTWQTQGSRKYSKQKDSTGERSPKFDKKRNFTWQLGTNTTEYILDWRTIKY